MQDEFLFTRSARVGIEFLGIFAGAQRAKRQRLGFALWKRAEPCARGSNPTSP
jgi:hypothetical protein